MVREFLFAKLTEKRGGGRSIRENVILEFDCPAFSDTIRRADSALD